MAKHSLVVKRVYEAPAKSDGARVLVDRLWPRGLTKEKAAIDVWLKALSPSDALRKEFHAQPEKWEAFRKDYAKELTGEAQEEAVTELRAMMRKGKVTLLYAAKDEERNNAAALRDWLEANP
jgi:uncharacterized protein YeaO (DUF488 family)